MKKNLIKRLSTIMMALLFALSCAVLFAACNNDDGGNRNGERCYVEDGYDRDCGIYIQYTTQYNGNSWIGFEAVDELTHKTYFIKGDILNIKAACQSYEYYADEDFALVINGEPVAMTKTFGHFFDGEQDMTYYTCTYTIQSDIVIDVKGVNEHTVNCTINAETVEDMTREFVADPTIEMSPEEQRELFIRQNYFLDDANVFVRFANPETFGLSKAEWGINELREYIVNEGGVVGELGVVTRADIYVFSKGYNEQCTQTFEAPINEGDYFISIFPNTSCYFNDEANEYGFKITLRPQSERDSETGEWIYKDGSLKLMTYKASDFYPDIRGSLQDKYRTKEEEYVFEDDIAEVPHDNPIFSIQYGNQPVGDWLEIGSFGVDGKVDVTVRLKKYSDPVWKALYDKMSIMVVDRVLKNGVDFTISTSGVVSLKLDKPYVYYDTTKVDAEIFEEIGIPMNYMYGYELYFDIVKMARDAGLVVEVDVQDSAYDGNDGLHIYFGDELYIDEQGQAYVPTNFYYDYMAGLIRGGEEGSVIRKALIPKGTYQTAIITEGARYTKATVTDGNGNKFEINVVPSVSGENTDEQLEAIVCENGKEVAVVRDYFSYESEDGVVQFYFYSIKALADLNVKEIRFHN